MLGVGELLPCGQFVLFMLDVFDIFLDFFQAGHCLEHTLLLVIVKFYSSPQHSEYVFSLPHGQGSIIDFDLS